MRLGITEYIDCAHLLPGHAKCGQLHGHTYKVEVVIEGSKGENGFVMDFFQLKKILGSVIEDLDHNNLNDLLPNPTAENIAELLCRRLRHSLEGLQVSLVSLKLWEGKNKWVMIDF